MLQFRTEVSTMLCFVSRWVSGWPEFFYVSSAKRKQKKENLSQFGCVFCHILAQMFLIQCSKLTECYTGLTKNLCFCHILIIFLSPKFLRRFNLRCIFRAKSEKSCGLRQRNYCDQFLLCTRLMHFCGSCRNVFDEKATKRQYLKSRPEKSITWKELLWKSNPVLATLTNKCDWGPQNLLAEK